MYGVLLRFLQDQLANIRKLGILAVGEDGVGCRENEEDVIPESSLLHQGDCLGDGASQEIL